MRNLFNRIAGRNRQPITHDRRRSRVQLEPLEAREMMTGGLTFGANPSLNTHQFTNYYSLTQGNLTETNIYSGQSTLIDTGVSSFQVGSLGSTSNLVFERTITGDLKMFDGANLTTLDSNVKSFAVGKWAGNNYLVELTSAGDLNTNYGSGWTTQDSNVKSFAVGQWAGNNYLVDLNSDCQLKTSYGSGWLVQDSQVQSFALGPWAGNNYLVDLRFNGSLNTSYGSGWLTQDTGVQQFALGTWAGQNTLADLSFGATWGALKTSTGTGWVTRDTNVRSFAMGPWAGSNYLVELTFANNLNTNYGSGWMTQDSNVQSFALGNWAGDHYLIELTSSGNLNTSVGTGWLTQDSGVQSFALGTWAGSDELIDLESNGTLLSSIGDGWNYDDSGVQSVALGAWSGFDQLVELTSDYTINQSDGSGFTQMGQGGQAFDLYTTSIFQRDFSDLGVRRVISADFVRDDAITFNDMLDVFDQVLSSGSETSAEAADLKALVYLGTTSFNMPGYVQNLANKVVNPTASDVTKVDNYFRLQVLHPTNLALYGLVQEYFIGDVHPALKSGDTGAADAYSTVAGDTSLFGPNGPSYTDVNQTTLGDCTYMASLAEAAAKDPSAIQNMFIDDGGGVYTVRFFENGSPDYVTVDSQFPAGGNLYDVPVGGVLWAALAEKAFAQVNGEGWLPTINSVYNATTGQWGSDAGLYSYDALNNGDPATAVAALNAITGLGASAVSVNTKTLATAVQAGDLVVLCSPKKPSDSSVVPNHAYAVLSYDPTPGAATPYTLFNPWGVNGGTAASTGVFYPGTVNLSATSISNDFTNQVVAVSGTGRTSSTTPNGLLGTVVAPEARKHDVLAVVIDSVGGSKRSDRIASSVVDRLFA